jgi:hypothetical protein
LPGKAYPKAQAQAQRKDAIAKMPTGTIEFNCIRINLKRASTFEPDENQIDSLIEFDLKIGDQDSRHLGAEVRQRNGTDFQTQPLEVGNVIGYDGPWNDEEFREICGLFCPANSDTHPRTNAALTLGYRK